MKRYQKIIIPILLLVVVLIVVMLNEGYKTKLDSLNIQD